MLLSHSEIFIAQTALPKAAELLESTTHSMEE